MKLLGLPLQWPALYRAAGDSLRSIKTRVTLGALGALIATTALTAVILVFEAERDTLAAHRQRELRDVARTADVLSRRVVDLQKGLAVTAELLDPAILRDDSQLARFFASNPVLRGQFANVFVADASGQVRAVSDAAGTRRPALNIADRDYFQRTLAQQRPIVSAALPGRLSNEPVVIFTYPLRQAGAVYGVIGGALQLSRRDLLDDIVDGAELESGRLVVVTDAQGHILAHPIPSRIMTSIAMEAHMADGYASWLAMGGSSGGAIEPSGLFLQQPGQVLAVAGVAGPDWLVWRAMPEAELLAPLSAARAKVLGWAAAIVAAASLLVLALMQRLLQPLVQLQHRAARLFDGQQSPTEGWPAVGGEIGELGRVLQQVGCERAQLEHANAQVMAQLGSVMAAAPVGILFTRAMAFELVSTEACRLLGRSEAALKGVMARSIFASSDDYDALGPQVAAAFAAGQTYVGELRFQRGDGSSFWGQLRGHPVDRDSAAAGTIWTLADIGDHVEQREQLEWLANHDALTGLGNRKLLERRLDRVLATRPGSMPASVVMLDLDRFKPVNDNAGHAAGDAMLKAVAAAIGAQVRGHDLVARVGGDEFALLLEDCPPEASLRIARNVLESIAAICLHWDGQILQVGASLGVAPLAEDTASVSAWLAQADAACYQAKAAGRGTVKIYAGSTRRSAGAASVPAPQPASVAPL